MPHQHTISFFHKTHPIWHPSKSSPQQKPLRPKPTTINPFMSLIAPILNTFNQLPTSFHWPSFDTHSLKHNSGSVKTPLFSQDLLLQIKKSITPRSSASFKQEAFISTLLTDYQTESDNYFLNKIKPGYRQLENAVKLNKKNINKGLCAGLTHTWFEYLFKSSSLIDIIRKGHPQTTLFHILEHQIIFGILRFQSKEREKIYHTHDRRTYDISPHSDSVHTCLNNYFALAKKNGWDQNGHLNTLSFAYAKKENSNNTTQEYETSGHVIGWVKESAARLPGKGVDRYILFDANSGEHLFHSQAELINYINHLLKNRRGADGISHSSENFGLVLDHFTNSQKKPSLPQTTTEPITRGGI